MILFPRRPVHSVSLSGAFDSTFSAVSSVGEKMRTLRRFATAVALPVAASAAVALAPTTAQAADGAGTITVCSKGSFSTFLDFPRRGEWVTVPSVPAGLCTHFKLGGSGVEQVNVNGADQYIASFQWDTGRHVTVNTVGTASGMSFYLSA
jgi:hypothetical protein